MAFDHRIRSGTRELRCGYTTGTCAALAAAGAAQLLLTGEAPEMLSLMTPRGWLVEVQPEMAERGEDAALCGVRKDAGDDPDVTDGLVVCARVSRRRIAPGEPDVVIEGGTGVGRVTKPGLDQPVGEAAINTVPRRMIAESVRRVCREAGYAGGLSVVIYVPGGEEAAAKTFNPQLGIEGGISILGTSGIVEPMSEQAIVETVAIGIRQAAAEGAKRLILVPGNYAEDFLEEVFRGEGGLPSEGPGGRGVPSAAAGGGLAAWRDVPRVKCSNYIGEAVDLAVLNGFREVLLVSHIGKLVKVAGGIMNTHSRMADGRRELFVAHAALCGAGQETARSLMEQATTDGCLDVLERAGLAEVVTASLLAAVQQHLERRAGGACEIGAVTFSLVRGYLGMTESARRMTGQ